MIIYSGTKFQFDVDVDAETIVSKIEEGYIPHFGHPQTPQVKAWWNSLQAIKEALDDPDIPTTCRVSVEFKIPLSDRRIDFLITGHDEKGRGAVVVVELKQWEHCQKDGSKDGLVITYTGGANRETTHPSYQAFSYAMLIRDYNASVEEQNIEVVPCAYLHNYDLAPSDPINDPSYAPYVHAAPMFGRGDRMKLRAFAKRFLKTGDPDHKLLDCLDNGKIRPSKRLQDSLKSMLKGNREFTLIDRQKVIYEEALALSDASEADGEKRVYLVQGGPGTGKTVLAMNLLVALNGRNRNAFYVTKNAAPRNTFKLALKGEYRKVFIDNLFQGSGSFVDAPLDACDCLLVDEAHRLTEKSGMFSNKGENEIKEIIHASKFSLFFLDEEQRVTFKDIGSRELIKHFADQEGAIYREDVLESQFRCNGSDGYLAWVDDVLEIRHTANADDFGLDYDFAVFDNPCDLFRVIKEKNAKNNKSRMVAGYCWNWIGEGKNDPNVYDIAMPEFGFKASWNLDGQKEPWAVGQGSVDQVGCVHTCQGLEFDYVGVILGPDIRYINGHIVTDRDARASTDASLHGIGVMEKKEGKAAAYAVADRIIKNTYRVLLTRGMKGCYIYCCDPGLQAYFKERLAHTKHVYRDA